MLGFKVTKSSTIRKRPFGDKESSPNQSTKENIHLAKQILGNAGKNVTPARNSIGSAKKRGTAIAKSSSVSANRRQSDTALITDYFGPVFKSLPPVSSTGTPQSSVSSKLADGERASDKFAHLLKPDPIKSLPDRYQNIHRIFKALEALISFHKTRSNGSHIIFDKIRTALENSVDMSVSLKDLSHVVAVNEDLFQLDVSKIGGDQSTLHNSVRIDWKDHAKVDGNICDQVKKRRALFEEKLMELAGSKEELPTSPFIQKFKTFDEIKSADDLKKKLEIFRKPSDVAAASPIKPDAGLSLLERIRLKEQRKKEAEHACKKQKTLNELSLISQIPKIASILDASYRVAKKNVMYFPQAYDCIRESMTIPLSEEETRAALKELAEIVPDWMSLNTNEFGTLVKLNHQVERANVMSAIGEYAKKCNGSSQ